jgi:hypothetical protein
MDQPPLLDIQVSNWALLVWLVMIFCAGFAAGALVEL